MIYHTYYFKIFELKDNELKTLFHGNYGSRKIKTNVWLNADIKVVSDGSRGKKYISGWHVFESYTDAEIYLKKFNTNKRKLVIVPCIAKYPHRKEHSKSNVLLMDWINVQWN